jgi:Co/Zn/Cd efflux system component
VFSYATNLAAETSKDALEVHRSECKRAVTDVAVPFFSVLCLLSVTAYITYDAVRVLQSPPAVDDVPLSYLYGFAIFNLVIDVLCTTLFFYRGREVFEEPVTIGMAVLPTISLDTSFDNEEDFGHLDEDLDYGYARYGGDHGKGGSTGGSSSSSSSHSSNGKNSRSTAASSSSSSSSAAASSAPSSSSTKKNLNMMSAFTHVSGDTVRTLSVLTAATVSLVTGIDGDICDAWAAIVVGLTIVAMTAPLVLDIVATAKTFLVDDGGDGGADGGRRGYSPVKTKEPIL